MRGRFLKPVVVLAALGLLAGACGSDGGGNDRGGNSGSDKDFSGPIGDVEAYPVLASSEIVVGANRFLIGLLDSNDAPIGTPGIDVDVTFYDLSSSTPEPVDTTGTKFIWSVRGRRGIYVTTASFDHSGKWGAEVAIKGEGIDETVPLGFDVRKKALSVPLGSTPPASDTPTAADVKDLSEISTDQHPDPAFYRLSVTDALKAGKPFVVVFATPKFCQSAVCGPTLDIVKSVAHDFPNVNFIHVEVYENLDDPSNLQPVAAVNEWGLPSEPWVFVVGSKGKVDAKYEGIVGAGELRKELSSL
jgi:hypothetical protein